MMRIMESVMIMMMDSIYQNETSISFIVFMRII